MNQDHPSESKSQTPLLGATLACSKHPFASLGSSLAFDPLHTAGCARNKATSTGSAGATVGRVAVGIGVVGIGRLPHRPETWSKAGKGTAACILSRGMVVVVVPGARIETRCRSHLPIPHVQRLVRLR